MIQIERYLHLTAFWAWLVSGNMYVERGTFLISVKMSNGKKFRHFNAKFRRHFLYGIQWITVLEISTITVFVLKRHSRKHWNCMTTDNVFDIAYCLVYEADENLLNVFSKAWRLVTALWAVCNVDYNVKFAVIQFNFFL